MSIRSRFPRAPWVTIVILSYSAIILGLGLWVSIATGQWLALVLALALVAPWESLWVTWQTRRNARAQDPRRKTATVSRTSINPKNRGTK
jgi:hypothetical protein